MKSIQEDILNEVDTKQDKLDEEQEQERDKYDNALQNALQDPKFTAQLSKQSLKHIKNAKENKST